MNYQDHRALFWINLIGHEAMSVLSLIETGKSFSGTADQLAHVLQLRTNKLHVLELLNAFGLVSLSHVGKMYTVFASGIINIPSWGLFCQQLFKALESGFKKQDIPKINWQLVFGAVEDETTAPVRVGLGVLETVEILIRSDKKEPRILINGNQKPNGNGFSFDEVRRGEFVCLCSHRIGTAVKAETPKLQIKLKPAVAELEADDGDDWRVKPESAWNAVDLTSWIMERYVETYATRPPFNRVDLMNGGILKNGVYALARMKGLDENQYMLEYKKYVDWLCGHKTFSLTPSSLFSGRTMGIFCTDVAKAAKAPSTGIPEAQNLPS